MQYCSGETEGVSGTAAHRQPSFQAARSGSDGVPVNTSGPPPQGGPQPSAAMGLAQSSPNEDKEADLDSGAKELQRQPQAMGLPQSLRNEHEEEDLDTIAEEVRKQPGPFEAFGIPQSSPKKDEEEDLDTGAEEPQGEPEPLKAFGLAQSSPNEEELDTIAEEPVAELRASETQGSHPHPLARPLEGLQQQQARKEARGLGSGSLSFTDDETGSQDQSKLNVSQPKGGAGGAGVAGDPRDSGDYRDAGNGRRAKGAEGGNPRSEGAAGDDAVERMEYEERGQAGHSHSHGPSEQLHHSLTGTHSSFTSPTTLRACQCLAGQCMQSLYDKERAVHVWLIKLCKTSHGHDLVLTWSGASCKVTPSICPLHVLCA